MELNKKVKIHILDIESPSKFWFRTDENAKKLDRSLQLYLKKHGFDENYEPKKDDLLIISIGDRQCVVRALEIMKGRRVRVSTLETGRTQIISSVYVVHLTDQSLIDTVINGILMGAVCDIQPAEMKYEKGSSQLKKVDNWSEKSIDIFTQIIQKSTAVYFEPKYSKRSCFYGKMSTGSDISNALIATQQAIRDDSETSKNEKMLARRVISEERALEKVASERGASKNVYEKVMADNNSDVNAVISHDLSNGHINDDSGNFSNGSSNGFPSSSARDFPNDTLDEIPNEVLNEILTVERQNKIPNEMPNETFDQLSEKTITTSESNASIGMQNGTNHTTTPDRAECLLESNSLSTITERTEITEHAENENDSKHDDTGSDVSKIPSYLYDNSESEEDPEQYEYKLAEAPQRRLDAQISFRNDLFDSLLKNATLPKHLPYINSNEVIIPVDGPHFSENLNRHLIRLEKVFPMQLYIWPYITNGQSVILIGQTEYYPHLVYLPAICDNIKKSNYYGRSFGPKVVIFASSCQQALEIQNLCECYLENDRVFSNAEDFSDGLMASPFADETQENKYQKSDIFITITRRIGYLRNSRLFKGVKAIIINDFESMSDENRKAIEQLVVYEKPRFQLIITSGHYVKELKVIYFFLPCRVISTNSYFDLYYFNNTNDSRSTHVEVFAPDSDFDAKLRFLKSKLDQLGRNKVVIACRTAKDAEQLWKHLRAKYNLDCALNERPGIDRRIIVRTLICSDDCLVPLNIRRSEHIIHFDLPDDFNTFSFRYSTLQLNLVSRFSNSIDPMSIIMATLRNGLDERTKLLVMLQARQYPLNISPRHSFSNVYRQINADAPLCVQIVNSFVDIGHLLKCQDRHFFSSAECLLTELRGYKVKILQVFTPTWFTVRLLQSRELNSTKWVDCNSSQLFDEFDAEFKEHQAKSFTRIENAADLNMNTMYAFKDGNHFYRCKIHSKDVDGDTEKIRIRCIDFGSFRRTNISNIGHLDENHTNFPEQSINLCLLKITPWNRYSWDYYDSEYMGNLLLGRNRFEKYGNGIFSLVVQCQIRNKLIFAFEAFAVANDGPEQHKNYRQLMIEKGLAFNATSGLREFLEHARDMNVLTQDQLNWFDAFLID